MDDKVNDFLASLISCPAPLFTVKALYGESFLQGELRELARQGLVSLEEEAGIGVVVLTPDGLALVLEVDAWQELADGFMEEDWA